MTRIHATSSHFYFDRRKLHFFLFRAEEDHVITIDLEKINTSSARNNKKSNFLRSKQILFENIWYDPFQDSVSLRSKWHAKRLLDLRNPIWPWNSLTYSHVLNTKATRERSKLESSRLAKYLGPRVPNSQTGKERTTFYHFHVNYY